MKLINNWVNGINESDLKCIQSIGGLSNCGSFNKLWLTKARLQAFTRSSKKSYDGCNCIIKAPSLFVCVHKKEVELQQDHLYFFIHSYSPLPPKKTSIITIQIKDFWEYSYHISFSFSIKCGPRWLGAICKIMLLHCKPARDCWKATWGGIKI